MRADGFLLRRDGVVVSMDVTRGDEPVLLVHGYGDTGAAPWWRRPHAGRAVPVRCASHVSSLGEVGAGRSGWAQREFENSGHPPDESSEGQKIR